LDGLQVSEKSCLIVVDMQYDFLPGGSLAIEGGDEIIDDINDCIDLFYNNGGLIVLTQDWHPKNHLSFASAHAGIQPFEPLSGPGIGPVAWPDHCIQGTRGAMLHEDLDQSKAHLIIRKGYNKTIDSYSVFVENDHETKTGLEGFLKEKGITTIYICGLALDYCVFYSAIDGRKAGFEINVLTDLTRAVGSPENSVEMAMSEMKKQNCLLVKFKQ